MSDRKPKAGWFGPKRFGFGVGPTSWQGRLVMAAFAGGAVVSAKAFQGRPTWTLCALAGLLIALTLIIWATYRRDERPSASAAQGDRDVCGSADGPIPLRVDVERRCYDALAFNCEEKDPGQAVPARRT